MWIAAYDVLLPQYQRLKPATLHHTEWIGTAIQKMSSTFQSVYSAITSLNWRDRLFSKKPWGPPQGGRWSDGRGDGIVSEGRWRPAAARIGGYAFGAGVQN
jgi:hypothetical protein